ncbi:glycoside hydrolase family 3 N-terminal domain-containing protein [Rubritalea marina]|uniref:glycoside hydrolase family 3 N-terminal domain-containing protein n=1 Tax=Rubritalea marina TaxID=361055 RepID=UPI000381F88F|nr:glycoside hydrolase family 3 N-terminal domain-containing protein [Rubritalea marina]
MHGQMLLLGIKGFELTTNEIHYLSKIQPGGFVLFSRNIESPEQVRSLTDSLREICDIPPIIAIDQEGGRVTRTKGITPIPPSADEMRRAGKIDAIAWHGIQTGQILSQLGINMNLAPVLDISYEPDSDNALAGRCYGLDAQEVINNAGVYNRNLRRTKTLTCGKHFPSCGVADVDPHHKLPISNKTIDEMLASDLIPYTALWPEMNGILTGHTHFSAIDPEQADLPGSLSYNVVTKLLREQLGYNGLVITDDLDMGAIINTYGRGADVKMAIEAGNDMAMICHQTDTAERALEALQELPYHMTKATFKRIKRVKKKIPKTYPFSQSRWDILKKEVMDLRIEVLGEENAHKETDTRSNSRSPVEDY